MFCLQEAQKLQSEKEINAKPTSRRQAEPGDRKGATYGQRETCLGLLLN